jgi:hypothetical protein
MWSLLICSEVFTLQCLIVSEELPLYDVNCLIGGEYGVSDDTVEGIRPILRVLRAIKELMGGLVMASPKN